ncbi:MAG: site-specific integrase [Methylococcales bacterium]
MRDAIRVRDNSVRTEQSYLSWIKRFIVFHNKRHLRAMGEQQVVVFLTHLAVAGQVAAKTQKRLMRLE